LPLTGKSPLSIARPETFGRFRVRADLGASRFGPVYLGKDPSSGARVTIRTFEPEVWSSASEQDELLDSFRKLCASKLEHAHAARPIAHGVEAGLPYLVYSYLPGTPMDVVVRQDAMRPPDEVLRRMSHVAEAIDFAAKQGVYHGMMAPCDIIFDHEKTGVAGFGIVQALLRVGVSVEAHAPYASPQRIAGAPPAKPDDVYALAALTLELLIGKASE
jgi:serine/threonine-protein kinase